ncbi:MAG: hypothetical protein ACXVEF_26165 [Polyangiales bacterium]
MSTLLARALEDVDLLVLGALADRVRQAERGDVVKIHIDRPTDQTRTFGEVDGHAHAFLRKVAIARLAGENGPIRIDAEGVGLQIAQVALTFGADEIVVPIHRMLEVYGEREAPKDEKSILREREICGLVTAAGRVPRIVERGVEREPDTTSHAVRKFRAPGREAAEAE